MIFISINENRCTIEIDGEIYKASPAEIRIMRCFMMSSSGFVYKAQLLEYGWPNKIVTDSSVVVAIAKLRAILALHNHEQDFSIGAFKNEDGSGYYLNNKLIILDTQKKLHCLLSLLIHFYK